VKTPLFGKSKMKNGSSEIKSEEPFFPQTDYKFIYARSGRLQTGYKMLIITPFIRHYFSL